jgi:hypothetical protein
MGTSGSFSGSKATGRDADHSPPVIAKVKKTSTPPYVFMERTLPHLYSADYESDITELVFPYG